MKVVQIDIENILGLEKLTVKPGALTIVTGSNGVGKTSFLEAIRAVAAEGHDASLLRTGAQSGFVRLTLDDGSVMQKTVTPKGSSFEGRHPKLGKVSRARAWVDSLIDQLGTDPLALIYCPAKKRAELLAETLAVEVGDKELAAAAGRSVASFRLASAITGLDRIDFARKALYDERTGLNRVAKDKRATASQLRATLPTPTEAPEDAKSLRWDADRVTKARDEKLAAISAEAVRFDTLAHDTYREAVGAEKERLGARLIRIAEDAAEKIRLFTEKVNAERGAAEQTARTAFDEFDAYKRDVLTTALRVTEESAAKQAAELRANLDPRIVELTAQVAVADERERENARAEKTREILAGAEQDAEKAEVEAKSISEAIGRLDELRASKLATLPIPGLELRDGDVFVDGLPFDRINTARQVGIALQVATLRVKDVPLLVSDHGEALDDANWVALTAKAAELGMNVILARRTDGPLNVETLPAERSAA
jgi:energy-coupling factor transporter ATP-binding protein EcfA2